MSRDASQWRSNRTLDELAAWLQSTRRTVILTHVKPDGDAVGSSLGLARAINHARGGAAVLGPAATPWYFGPIPDWFNDLAGPTDRRVLTEDDRADHDHRPDPDSVVIIDTGAWTQLHEVREWLEPRRNIAAVVDHHRTGDPDVADRLYVDTGAAAACQIASDLCVKLLKVRDAAALPVDVATPLYLGIATDTGWFRHSNVTPSVMRTAASLLEAGVDHSRLYELVEQRDRPARLRLLARALGSMEFLKDQRVAIMSLTQRDFSDCHAAPTDTAGFSEMALDIQSVQCSVLLTEAFVDHQGTNNFITKVSMRSKNGPSAPDVNAIAQRLGGGGHVRAAGAKLSLPMGEARARVIAALMA